MVYNKDSINRKYFLIQRIYEGMGWLFLKYRRKLKYYLLKLFRLHDSPKSVAGGLAWGTFVHFYPTCGLGALFAVGMARIFNTNLAAATLGWAITTPLFPLFFYFNFQMGELILGPCADLTYSMRFMRHLHFRDIVIIGKAFAYGSLVNGIIGVIFLWWLGYILLKRYRKETLNYIRRIL